MEDALLKIMLNPHSLISISKSIEEMTGYSSDSFLSEEISFSDLFHPDDKDILEKLFLPVKEEDSGSCNIRIRQMNGHIRCIHCLFSKTLGANDSMQLELTLQDSKSLYSKRATEPILPHFNAIMESTGDFIFFKDLNHILTGASQTLANITGFKESWTALLGQTDYEIFPEELADIYYRLEKDIYSGAEAANEVQEFFDTDGNKGWVDNRKFPMKNSSGEIIGLFGIARDVTRTVQTERDLIKASKHSRALFDLSIDPIFIGDIETGMILDANHAACDLIGRTKSDIIGMHQSALHPSGEIERYQRAFREHIESQEDIKEDMFVCHKDGRQIPVEIRAMVMDTEEQSVIYGSFRDLSKSKESEKSLLQAEEIINRSLSVAFIWRNEDGWPVDYVSENVSELLGYSASEFREGRINYNNIIHIDDKERVLQEVAASALDKSAQHFAHKPYRITTKAGEVRWVEDETYIERNLEGEALRFEGVIHDITKRMKLENNLEEQAHKDFLTGLYNRRFFIELSDIEIDRAERHKRATSIFILDIDFFKSVNDRYGHETGDFVLKHLAKVCLQTLRKADVVSRWGGEEFVALLPETGLEKAVDVANRLREAIANQDIQISDSSPLNITVSIGVVQMNSGDKDIDAALRRADKALYQAKESGRNRVIKGL